MSCRVKVKISVVIAALVSLAAEGQLLAGSATWHKNPTSSDWYTASNWTPNTVPSSESDIASFSRSTLPDVTVTARTEISGIHFNRGANSYTIATQPGWPLILIGEGIVNESGAMQKFVSQVSGGFTGGLFFEGVATAGDGTVFSALGGFISFHDSSNAATASITVGMGPELQQGAIDFWETTTVANASIVANDGAQVNLFDLASAGNATFTISSDAFLFFGDDATADHAMATCIGGKGIYSSSIHFHQSATAAEGTFTATGGGISGEAGGFIHVSDSARTADAIFAIKGGAGPNLTGALLTFDGNSTAQNASINVEGGLGGSEGGAVIFDGNASGDAATISLLGNGELDISSTHLSGVTVGSLTGDGLVYLGTKTLTIGSNGQSTTFSGVIQESGGVTKIGTGTLTLTGADLYTGATTVSGGVLNVANRRGSATGAGAVQVNTGTLGGRGIIAGPVIISSGAFLAPAVGSNKQTTLTLKAR